MYVYGCMYVKYEDEMDHVCVSELYDIGCVAGFVG